MIENDTRYTSEINPVLRGKSSIQQEEKSFHKKTGLKFKEETSKLLYLEHSFVWYGNLDTSGSGSEIPGKF